MPDAAAEMFFFLMSCYLAIIAVYCLCWYLCVDSMRYSSFCEFGMVMDSCFGFSFWYPLFPEGLV